MPNQHITGYLDSYLDQPAVDFAVLISGPWGVGKTHLVKSYLNSGNRKYLYVSVNGIHTESDLRRRFAYAAYPVFEDQTIQALGSIARSVAGVFRLKSDLKIEDIVSYDHYSTIIVDDLERSTLPIEVLFGFINPLVEEERKHLILIANEEELISSNKRYENIKEKLIGFTLKARPDIRDALQTMRGEFSPIIQRFIENHSQDVCQTFEYASSPNIRIFKQTINEFEEILEVITSNSRIPPSVYIDFFNLFYAIAAAYKTGEINREDIRERTGDSFIAHVLREEKGIEDRLDRLNKRHKNIDIYLGIIDSEYLEKKVCDGLSDIEPLNRGIGDLVVRWDAYSNPEWRNVWYFVQNPEEVTRRSFNDMMAKFKNREYRDPGIILHVFGLLMKMVEVGISPWSEKRVARESKLYLDDLARSGALPLLQEDFLEGFRYGAAYGLGFTSSDNPLFRELWTYYQHKSDSIKMAHMVATLRDCVDKMADRHPEFCKILVHGDPGPEFYSTPLLHNTSSRTFVRRFMELDATKQSDLMTAIGGRYKGNPYPAVLETERPWLLRVAKDLRQRTRRGNSLTRYRIQKYLEWNFDPYT